MEYQKASAGLGGAPQLGINPCSSSCVHVACRKAGIDRDHLFLNRVTVLALMFFVDIL
jgi:hypothetical protein